MRREKSSGTGISSISKAQVFFSGSNKLVLLLGTVTYGIWRRTVAEVNETMRVEFLSLVLAVQCRVPTMKMLTSGLG